MEIKFNIDIDDFFEDDNISVKESIKQSIVFQITERLYKAVSEQIEINISEVVKKKLEELLEKTYNNFLETEVIVTDQYGDKVDGGKIKELVKKRWENYLTEKVDEYGDSTNRYNAGMARINYLIEKQLEKHSESFMSKALDEITKKIETTLSEELKNQIGDKIAKTIGVEKITKKLIKK